MYKIKSKLTQANLLTVTKDFAEAKNIYSDLLKQDPNFLPYKLGLEYCEFKLSQQHKNMDICCITDSNYIIPTTVLIYSIKKSNYKNNKINIYVLVPNGEKNKIKLLENLQEVNFHVHIIEVDTDMSKLHKYKTKNNWCMASPSALFKFLIPQVFPQLNRILYLDTDLIVRKNISSFFNTILDGVYLCAIPDFWILLPNREGYCFNSGVMLMNLQKMRIDNITEKLIEAKRNSSNFDLMDQNIFNSICDKVILNDCKYNFAPVCYKKHKDKLDIGKANKLTNTNYRAFDDIISNVHISHWAGIEKPWKSQQPTTLFADEWWSLCHELQKKGLICENFNIYSRNN